MKEQPNYYSILTADVRYDKDLKPNAKILYSEISALSHSKGFCFANNVHFAELYDVNRATISRWISQLANKEYITIILVYKPNSKEVKERRLFINDSAKNKIKRVALIENKENATTIKSHTLLENSHSPNDKKLIDNTTSFNTTSNNKKTNKKKVCVSESSNQNDFSISELEIMLNEKKGIKTQPLKAKDERKKVAAKKESVSDADVERVYNAYPTICPYKKSRTQKSRTTNGGKNKSQQIKTIEAHLKNYTVEQLENHTKEYLNDCKPSKTWLKLFSTFLNDIKKNGLFGEENGSNDTEEKMFIWSWLGQAKITGNRQRYEKDKRQYKDCEFVTVQIGN